MDNPTRLVPPPEFAHLALPAHFLRNKSGEPMVAMWIEDMWIFPGHRAAESPEELVRLGITYWQPCDPSVITLNPDDPAQVAEIGQQIDAFTQKMFDAVVDYASRDDLSRAVIRRLKELKR